MNKNNRESFDDDKEKRITDIQDLLFKEQNPANISQFLNNFFEWF